MTSRKQLKPVIVRTVNAGVHFGYLVSQKGMEVRLQQSRRIWRWLGANTLSEIALYGLDISKSRVAERVNILLTNAIEVIDCTEQSMKNLESARWV
jgi:uncharacterized protein DUF6948